MNAYAVLLCAGSGRRMREDKNKVLIPIAGKNAVRRSLEALLKSGCFEKIIMVIRPQDKKSIEDSCGDLLNGVIFAEGGKERQDSVYNALRKIPQNADIIAIHDAARCFVSSELVRQCVESARDFGSGSAARRCVDTVKRIDENENIVETINRDEIVLIQTPQVFKAEDIRRAYERAKEDGFKGTDDCSMMEHIGMKTKVIVHNEENFKLTYRSDLKRGEGMLNAADFRVGNGIDSHKLVPGRKLILGGVCIPYEKGLLGHSDADVLTHAVMDALIGAAALGDIGRHFPDSDMKYKDACSITLLKEVKKIIEHRGFRIGNIDATIIAQRPKLLPYIDEMRKNITNALEIDIENVNIKATTTEEMGFEGRGEGISANAVCIIQKQV